MLEHVLYALQGTCWGQVHHVIRVHRIIDGMDPRVWHVKTEVSHGVAWLQARNGYVHALLGTRGDHVRIVQRIIHGMDQRVWHVQLDVQ